MHKGDLIQSDVLKVLLDYETEEELRQAHAKDPDNVKILNHLRYSLINNQVALMANVGRNCQSMKAKIGHHAYTIQTLIELVKAREEIFDIELNDGEYVQKDVKT